MNIQIFGTKKCNDTKKAERFFKERGIGDSGKNMHRKMNLLIWGHVLLILCCAFYLIWWGTAFRPGFEGSRVGGVEGILIGICMGVNVICMKSTHT